MVEPITAIYVHEDDDWTITVSGLGKSLTARAPGIIAARDRTDQLVEELAPQGRSTVVHLLNGSALEFTATYMSARLTLPEDAKAPLEVPPPGAKPKAETAKADAQETQPEEREPGKDESQKGAAGKPAAKPPIRAGKHLPKAVEPRKAASKPASRPKKDDVNGGAMPATKA
jgi:hypothetical protein